MKINEIIAFFLGLIVGGIFVYFIMHETMPHEHEEETHPIGYADSAEEVHIHSDFVLFLDGKQIDLSADEYQSKTSHILHDDVHLHDSDDEVIHRHENGITLAELFGSLGFTLTNECITTDMGMNFCNTEDKELMVFVNDERITEPASYVNKEEDRILLYHGNPTDSESIKNLLLDITKNSCIYSGTCPERGVAPPESCGLTCEL